MAIQASRQEIVHVLRKTGFGEVAEDALRQLPDRASPDHIADFLAPYGITKDELISRMGGSP